MRVEYLGTLAYSEIGKERRAAEKRRLRRALNNLDDDIIGDLIGIKIEARMPVSVLSALDTVYSLRLQLAQVSGDSLESLYEILCRERQEQISKALTKKYAFAGTVNEKIEILERLESIEMFVHAAHSRFALDKSEELNGFSDLTYSQRLRLSWMFGMESVDYKEILATILPQVKDAFDIKTVTDLEMFGTEDCRRHVMELYSEMIEAALHNGDTPELGRLLNIGAHLSYDPQRRPILLGVADRATRVAGVTRPEMLVIPKAAEMYGQLDTVLGKYTDVNSLTT